MKWIGFSGSWRNSTPKLRYDARTQALGALKAGNGIVTGGALGVDYLVTEAAMEFDPSGQRILIFLPSSLADDAAHYKKRVAEGVISQKTAQTLLKRLEQVRKANSYALVENVNENIVNQQAYHSRNGKLAAACDELMAFHANHSKGTQDTIDTAQKAGKRPLFLAIKPKI